MPRPTQRRPSEGRLLSIPLFPSRDHEAYSLVVHLHLSEGFIVVVVAAGLEFEGISDESPVNISASI